jgi:hypothetical protein
MLVRDLNANIRQHAHRESDLVLRNKKNGSIPTSLNRPGIYSHKNTNARVFLIFSNLFFARRYNSEY